MNYLLWGSLSPPLVRQPYHLAGGAGPPGADRRLPQGAPVGSEALERWVTEPADGRDRRTTPPRVAAQGRPDRRHRRRAARPAGGRGAGGAPPLAGGGGHRDRRGRAGHPRGRRLRHPRSRRGADLPDDRQRPPRLRRRRAAAAPVRRVGRPSRKKPGGRVSAAVPCQGQSVTGFCHVNAGRRGDRLTENGWLRGLTTVRERTVVRASRPPMITSSYTWPAPAVTWKTSPSRVPLGGRCTPVVQSSRHLGGDVTIELGDGLLPLLWR